MILLLLFLYNDIGIVIFVQMSWWNTIIFSADKFWDRNVY